MSLVRWSPLWDPFNDMDEAMNRLPSTEGVRSFVPAINMYETDKAVVVETPLAGVNPEDVTVSVEKGVLTLRGSSTKEHEVEEKNYYRKEVRSGTFFREIPLPTAVAEDAVEAEFENGMLRITAPKAAPAAAKKIDVKVKKK